MLVFIAVYEHLLLGNQANWTNGTFEGWSYVFLSAGIALWQGMVLQRKQFSLEATFIAALLVQPLHMLIHSFLPGQAHISALGMTDFRMLYPFVLLGGVVLGYATPLHIKRHEKMTRH
jgi:hypothetical protein